MSNKAYIDKYTKLIKELMDFLLKHGNEYKKLPNHASFVAFSASDKELNKYNEKMLEELKKEDKPLVKAEEPKSKGSAWTFTVVAH